MERCVQLASALHATDQRQTGFTHADLSAILGMGHHIGPALSRGSCRRRVTQRRRQKRTRASTEAPAEEASGPPGDVLLAGRIVILDPGHGGTDKSLGDFGTEGVGPAPEKEIVLDVARHLANLLRDAGAEVVMTRDDDVNPAQGTPYEAVPHGQLLARVAKAREAGGDVLISIHGDASADPAVHGTTTYYYHERSRIWLATYKQPWCKPGKPTLECGAKASWWCDVRFPLP